VSTELAKEPLSLAHLTHYNHARPSSALTTSATPSTFQIVLLATKTTTLALKEITVLLESVSLDHLSNVMEEISASHHSATLLLENASSCSSTSLVTIINNAQPTILAFLEFALESLIPLLPLNLNVEDLLLTHLKLSTTLQL